ncbi:conserved exported hypothetical protein [Candidatus Magnetomoraceae bacterium gMMP-15]
MKKLTPSIIFIFLLIFATASAFANDEKAVAFTLEDRDRLIKLEVRVDEIKSQILRLELRLESQIQKQGDDLMGFMLWGFGILFSSVLILIGFVLWDRRTTLAPVAKTQKEFEARMDELEKKEKRLEEVLTVCVKRDAETTEFARTMGMQI